MKNFLQNLLIVFALGLCGLCARQWYYQTLQRNQLGEKNQIIFDRDTAIQGFTNSIQTQDRQISELDKQVSQLNKDSISNSEVMVAQKHDLARLKAENETLNGVIVQYTNNIALLETKLRDTYDGIKKQNDALTELARQRDEFVGKYNDSIANYNDLPRKYNEVVDRLNKLQASLTNQPAARK